MLGREAKRATKKRAVRLDCVVRKEGGAGFGRFWKKKLRLSEVSFSHLAQRITDWLTATGLPPAGRMTSFCFRMTRFRDLCSLGFTPPALKSEGDGMKGRVWWLRW